MNCTRCNCLPRENQDGTCAYCAYVIDFAVSMEKLETWTIDVEALRVELDLAQ